MKTYRLFLASSEKLRPEREQIELAFGRLNKRLAKKNVRLETILWEDIDPEIVVDGMQSGYNRALKECNVLVLLYWGELGKFTQKEYKLGFELLKQRKIKKVYVFEKKTDITFEPKPENLENLKELKEFLNKEGEENWPVSFETASEITAVLETRIWDAFEDPNNPDFVYGQPAYQLSTNSPAEPTVFLGREEELTEIRKRLDKGGKLMLINAEGGIGKTTLAAKYWNESLHEYKHNAWLFCDGGIINALKDLAPKLNVDLAGMDEQQQLNTLRRALSEKQDDFLLVLDNANEEEDIKVFRQQFEGFHWHVLITSRCQGVLDKEQELPINHLPPPLAKELFERYYIEDNPNFDALLDKVLYSIQYHTLLTEVFAKNLAEAAEMGHLNLENFLAKLENEGLHLGKNSFEIENNDWATKREAATTDDILDALYDFGKLSHEQNYILVNMAMLPSEPYQLPFINMLLSNETNRNERQIRATLKALVKKGWITENDKKYRLSPVIQDLALHKNKESLSTDAQDLLDRLNHILAADGYNLLNTSLTAARPFIKLLPQLNKSLANNPSQDIGGLNFNAGIYFNNIGDLVNARYCAEQIGIICLNLLVEEPNNLDYKNGLAISYQNLGDIYNATGDWKNALLNYQEYNRIQYKNVKSSPKTLEYKNGLAISYSKLGGIYEAKGDWKNALLNYQEFNRIANENVQATTETLQYKNILAISYEKLGGIYQQTCDWKNALLNYQEYSKIANENVLASPETLQYKNILAISYEKLGLIYGLTGNWKNALLNYQEDFRITKEIYESSPENLSYKDGLAISYEKLGGLYEQTRDWKNALLNYKEYNRLQSENVQASPDTLEYKNGLAISYSKLGGIYQQTGDWKNALLNYKEDYRISKEIYENSPENVNYQFGFATSLQLMGIATLKLSSITKARPYLSQSYQVFQRLFEQAQTPLNYQKMKELENLIQFQNNGCFSIIVHVLKFVMKIPFFKKRISGMVEQNQKNLQEEYRSKSKQFEL